MRRRGALLLAALLGLGCELHAPAPADSPAPSAPATAASASIPRGFEARPATRVVEIVDGDTVVLAGGERIRVLGIDTPEMRAETATERTLARNARAELQRLLASGRVVPVARPGQMDQYERTLAYLHAAREDGRPGEDLGARLIETGFARIYPSEHPRLAPYLALQETARARGLGIWTPDGTKALGLGFELEVDAAQAGEHVGRRARVVGKIFDTHRSEGALYLNFGPDYRTAFTAVVVKTQWELFPADAERAWKGRLAAVTGEIRDRRGRPEIRLKSPDQIELLER